LHHQHCIDIQHKFNNKRLHQIMAMENGNTDFTTSIANEKPPAKKGVPRTVTISPTFPENTGSPVFVTTKKSRPTHVKNKSSGVTPTILAAEPSEIYPDRIRLGICAMDKKARSKPMAEILSRLDETLFHVVFFGDDMILNQPIEEW
jgi:hypothetical protein